MIKLNVDAFRQNKYNDIAEAVQKAYKAYDTVDNKHEQDFNESIAKQMYDLVGFRAIIYENEAENLLETRVYFKEDSIKDKNYMVFDIQTIDNRVMPLISLE